MVGRLEDLFLMECSLDDFTYQMRMSVHHLFPSIHPAAFSHLQCHILVPLVILKANLNAHLHVYYLYSPVLVPLVLL